MEQAEFDSSDKATECLSDLLTSKLSGTSPSAIPVDLVAQDLLSIWASPLETVQPGRSRPAHIAGLRWVIRNDDLKLLDSILDGLKASAGAGFFLLGGLTMTGTAVAAAGLLAGFLKLAYNASSKGAILDARDYSVIAAMFGHPAGFTKEEILERLSVKEPDWTIDEVGKHLDRLSETPSRSGKIALVWKSADEKWRTAGV